MAESAPEKGSGFSHRLFTTPPAHQDGVVIFGAQDGHAYALDAKTGARVWLSQKLPGAGWHSWWPVIYKDVVMFTRTEVEKGLVGFQNEWLFSKKKAANSLPGLRGTEPGDWVVGEPTMDIRTNANDGTIPDWFERYPWRRSLIVLNRQTGVEVAFDLDQDGTPDAAPMLWAWTHGGTCYPPLVSGHDGVIYFRSVTHAVGPGIPGAMLAGWKCGTPFLSLPVSSVQGQSGFWPGDEPVGISAGGKFVYWSLCNDRFIGSIDLSIANAAFPSLDGTRQWRHLSGDGFKTSTLPAGYNSQVGQYLWSIGPPRIKPMYWAHGDNVGPTIYSRRCMCTAAMRSSRSAPAAWDPVPRYCRWLGPVQAGANLSRSLGSGSKNGWRRKFRRSSGHLMAGFAKIGLVDFMTVSSLGQHLLHYWHNPVEGLLTLLRALPHLPADMQEKVRQYLKREYDSFPPHKFMHIGFRDGAPREPFDYPPSTPRIFEHNMGPQTVNSFRGWSKPPQNVYAMWKYAQAGLAEPASVFSQASGVIGATPSDSYLAAFPHVHNAYIAGYVGYVGAGEDGKPALRQPGGGAESAPEAAGRELPVGCSGRYRQRPERSILIYVHHRLEFHVPGPGTGGLPALERAPQGPGRGQSIHANGALLDSRPQRGSAARERHNTAPAAARALPGSSPDSENLPR